MNMAMQPVINDELIAAVVAGCQRGEAAALEQLYDLYADRLYRYLLVRVGNSDTAADLTTEVFLRVINSIGAFRLNPDLPAATVSAWLYRIAANLAAGHYRARRRVSWLGVEDGEAYSAVDPGPELLAEQKEELAQLAQAMAGLNEEQRLVITGKFVEKMTNAEIATWLGKTEGAVKSLQHRALRSLARLMHLRTPQERKRTWMSYAGE
jgi:RNA polymerase sigma-70 factor, ECF subfamily